MPSRGSARLEVVALAVDEHHHVGVLLDRAGFPQVGELGLLVLAVLDLARELGQRRSPAPDSSLASAFSPWVISLTSCTRFSAPPVAGGDQLQVVDDDQVEAGGALQPPRAGGQLGDARCRRCRRCRAALPGSRRRRRAPGRTPWRRSRPCGSGRDGTPRDFGQQAHGQLLGATFPARRRRRRRR